MKERVKTFLLFLLVFSSVFMTSKLWIKLPGQIGDIFGSNEVLSATYALSDMIAPSKYLLNFDNKNHTITYDDSRYGIWENSQAVLSSLLDDENAIIEEITKDQYLRFHEQRSLVFYFPEEINTYILAKTWGVKSPNEIADTIPDINEIYIYLGNGNPFFVFSDGNRFIMALEAKVDTRLIKENLIQVEEAKNYDYYYSMRESFDIESDIYIPYEMNTRLSTIYVGNEIANLDENEKRRVAERFFNKDIDYIREFVESNGSTIYSFNNRVLKLNANGTLEYFHAIEGSSTERNLYSSLNTAAEFIAQNASTTKGMYLSSIDDIEFDGNLGYRLSFKYRIRGIPVHLGNREVGDYIQIDVFNNHVRSYKLLTRREVDMGITPTIGARSMMSSIDILDKNYDYLEREYLIQTGMSKAELGEDIKKEVLNLVSDISLAYYDPNLKEQSERLIGVWTITFNNRVYAFNAFTGNLVFER